MAREAKRVFWQLKAQCPSCDHESPDPYSEGSVPVEKVIECWNCGEEFEVTAAQEERAEAQRIDPEVYNL
jgi:hypothetical protein